MNQIKNTNRTIVLKSRPIGDVWPLLEAGKVRPIIHATIPLADIRKAHELMETAAHIGKIMLKVKEDVT